MEENEKMPTESEEITPSSETQPEPAVEAAFPTEAPSAPPESLPDFEPIAVGSEEPEVTPSEVYIPEEALAPERSRGGRFKDAIRKAFIWLLVFAFIYLAGVVTIYILELQPTMDTLEQTQAELEQANQDIADLQLELDQATVDYYYSIYLQVTADVYAARLAMLAEDTALAKIYLANADENLELILEDVAAFDQALADALATRLDLVVINVEEDIEQAILDAEILSQNLETVAQGVFGVD